MVEQVIVAGVKRCRCRCRCRYRYRRRRRRPAHLPGRNKTKKELTSINGTTQPLSLLLDQQTGFSLVAGQTCHSIAQGNMHNAYQERGTQQLQGKPKTQAQITTLFAGAGLTRQHCPGQRLSRLEHFENTPRPRQCSRRQ